MAGKEVLLIAKGRVQGVGYRWFVKDRADKLGIKGYVMNLANGDVEILAQADEDKIKEFMREINAKQDFGPYVEKLVILSEKEAKAPYKGFFIRRE